MTNESNRRLSINTTKLARIAACSLAVGIATTTSLPLEQAAVASPVSPEKTAVKLAQKAGKLLASDKAQKGKAVVWAEKAVSFAPNNAALRNLLGRAYLANGRLTAAETSFADALALDPSNARAALNLALMKASRGANSDAQMLLDDHGDRMNPKDRGLAQALAGDVSGGIATLEAAARATGADSQTRQNLALAYALGNRWNEARAVASQDLAAEMVDARLASWAQMAHPKTAWDQVAGVLGVRPVYDPGQPQQLALRITPRPEAQSAMAEPALVPAAIQTIPDAAPAPEAQPSANFEVAQAAPAPAFEEPPVVRAPVQPIKQAVVPANSQPGPRRPAVESGKFVVQLGAFADTARAQAGWNQATSKLAELREYDPQSARVTLKKGAFYRLSVSGFTNREVAGQLCTRVKSAGGQCFVRSVAGDQPLQWVRKGTGGTRIAARK